MKNVIFTLILLSSAVSHAAGNVTCFSQYFNGNSSTVLLKATALSDASLRNVTLTIDGEVARSAAARKGALYDGRKYKNMVEFSLEGSGVKSPSFNWADCSMRFLLPVGFSKFTSGSKFEGIVIESASDGGSYNRVFCKIVK